MVNSTYLAVTMTDSGLAYSGNEYDSRWCLDSGVTHYMTPSLQEFQDAQPYQGKESIMIGNGLFLKITHVDTVKVLIKDSFVTLHHVYCVPKLRKNFFSITRFSYDNECSFSLDENAFVALKKTTGVIIILTGTRY